MNDRRKMSLSLDLDNKWSYLRTYGNGAWKEFPSYLEAIVPRILKFLEERDLRITFFIVGKDAALERNRDAIRSISRAGHEIGNHSFYHEPWLHLYSESDLDRDLTMAEEAIEGVTGKRVNGFRGPGYSLSESTLKVLKKRGYHYDATAFPNVLNPFARAYLFATANLSKEEKEKRKALFGSFSDAFRPIKPYEWRLGSESLLELPVTTMPVLKTPIHFSYLTYLATFSTTLALAYLRFAVFMCVLTRTEPSLLLHPLDFMGREDDGDLADFPGMRLPAARKLELMGRFFDVLLATFDPMTMGEHAERLADGAAKQFRPIFSR